MNVDCEGRYNPGKNCGELLEVIYERWGHEDEPTLKLADARQIAKRAIARGDLTLPKFTHTTAEILRRMAYIKEVERKRALRTGRHQAVKPFELARADCLELRGEAWGQIAAIARKRGCNVKALQEWHRKHLLAEAEKRRHELMTRAI